MAWSAPMTAVANEIFTAAQFNTYVRDNLNETMPALATEAGQYFVSDGSHSLKAYKPAFNTITTGTQSMGNDTWTDVIGGSVTLKTNSEVLVHIAARLVMDTDNRAGILSYRVSGATTIKPEDHQGEVTWDAVAANQNSRMGTWTRNPNLTPGWNTFTLQAWAGNGVTVTVEKAHIIVLPLN